jgi:hypothetical protein
VQQQGDRHLLLLADGLGHGPLAAEASLAAVRIFQENSHYSPPGIMAALHTALRSTRGAAVAIADITLNEQTVCYTGVGNIASALITTQRSVSMVSHNGTVGMRCEKFSLTPIPGCQVGYW